MKKMIAVFLMVLLITVNTPVHADTCDQCVTDFENCSKGIIPVGIGGGVSGAIVGALFGGIGAGPGGVVGALSGLTGEMVKCTAAFALCKLNCTPKPKE